MIKTESIVNGKRVVVWQYTAEEIAEIERRKQEFLARRNRPNESQNTNNSEVTNGN